MTSFVMDLTTYTSIKNTFCIHCQFPIETLVDPHSCKGAPCPLKLLILGLLIWINIRIWIAWSKAFASLVPSLPDLFQLACVEKDRGGWGRG